MTEYWLQKKTIGGWSHVTWYSDLEQAQLNFTKVSAGNSGYSWRVVKAETVVEKMLDDSTPIEAPEIELTNVKWITKDEALKQFPLAKSGWIKPRQPIQDAPKSSGWGGTASGWGNATSESPSQSGDGRGAKPGSVCLMHHSLKKRMRAMPDELNVLLSQGWERGGPRTQFRE